MSRQYRCRYLQHRILTLPIISYAKRWRVCYSTQTRLNRGRGEKDLRIGLLSITSFNTPHCARAVARVRIDALLCRRPRRLAPAERVLGAVVSLPLPDTMHHDWGMLGSLDRTPSPRCSLCWMTERVVTPINYNYLSRPLHTRVEASFTWCMLRHATQCGSTC